jgi:hypothetical protein
LCPHGVARTHASPASSRVNLKFFVRFCGFARASAYKRGRGTRLVIVKAQGRKDGGRKIQDLKSKSKRESRLLKEMMAARNAAAQMSS